jgi:hypothetical protein
LRLRIDYEKRSRQFPASHNDEKDDTPHPTDESN